MSIDKKLIAAFKDQIKVTLSLSDGSFPYHNAIIIELDNDFISFTIPEISGDRSCLKEYTFKKTCVEGIGFIRAGIEIPENELDDDCDDFEIFKID